MNNYYPNPPIQNADTGQNGMRRPKLPYTHPNPPIPKRRYRSLWPAAILGAIIGSLTTALIHPRPPIATPSQAAGLVCYAPPMMQGDGIRKASQNQQQPAILCAPVVK